MTEEIADEGPLREALAFAVMAMILVDGQADPAEIDHARAALARCGLFAANTVEEDRRLLALVERQVREAEPGRAEAHAEVLAASPWRYAALAIMADIMAADGTMQAEEVALIQDAGRRFAIPQAEVMAIVTHVGTDAIEDLITGMNLDAAAALVLDR
ncbi:MAG: TerB family tellurite resistance protein [Pseudomonadota bacterium]